MKTTLSIIFLKVFTLIFFILFLCFPKETLQGASSGLLLWFQTVLPTLLPTMIAADFLLRIEADRYVSYLVARPFSLLFGLSKDGCYGALIGLLSGYPMGAKTAAALRKEGRISLSEANYLLAFTNQPSPMFLIGYLCLGLYADYNGNMLIFPMLFGVYGSALLISIIYRASHQMHNVLWTSWHADLLNLDHSPKKTGGQKTKYPSTVNPTHNKSADSFPLSLLESSMMTSFEVMVKIGGYMMLFSIAEAYIDKLPMLCVPAKSIWMGITEMTTGSRHIASGIELPWSLALCGAVTAFGGLSSLAQTTHILQGSGLHIGRYVLWKVLQGILAGILILLCCYP